jgi:hypothetical protein
LEGIRQIPLRDRELSDSFRNILEVARKSLELALEMEAEIAPAAGD